MKRVSEQQPTTHTLKQQIILDSAGAVRGGAARLLREIQTYLSAADTTNIELIGVGHQLTSSWLIKRELLAASATKRISFNNASFLNPKGENITLLHNILQFATPEDLERLEFVRSRRLRVQTPVIRALSRASKKLIVPCTRMAEQVAQVAPSLADRLEVRFHPITQPHWAGTLPKNPRDVLLPIVPSPYKNLDQHIPEFLEASQDIPGEPVRLIIPNDPSSFPELADHPRIKFIGSQTSEELDQWWQDCGAVFFPTEFEAFGFPLAEGRVYGRNVIAQNTAQNKELAGQALVSYTRYDQKSLHKAIHKAISTTPTPDPKPFDPEAYFEWLLHAL